MDKVESTAIQNAIFSSIWNYTTDSIIVIDLQGRVLDVNPAFEALHGWTKEEVLGIVLPVMPTYLYDEADERHAQVRQGEHVSSHESSMLRKDGTMFYASISISPYKDYKGSLVGFIGMERDISDKKKIEASLLEAENLYSHLAESAAVGVYLGQQGLTLYVNPYLCTLFGYTREEFMHLQPEDLILADELEAIRREAIYRLIEQSQSEFSFTIKGKKKDKSIVILEGNSCLISYGGQQAFLSTVQNITTKQEIEQHRRDSAELYLRIVKFLPEPIVLSDNGIIVYANKSAVKLLGGEDDTAAIGKSVFDYVHPDEHAIALESLQQSVDPDHLTSFKERRLISEQGHIIETELSSIRIHNYQDSMLLLTVIRDLSDRKKAEERLVRSEKLSVIGQLAAGVAHEIRNPLTALKGFTQLLKSKNEDNHYYCGIMLNELERINLIVNEFMTLAKPHYSQYADWSLEQIMQGVLSILDTQAVMMNIHIVTEFEEDLPLIHCEANQLKQVFMNIIKNAIEAMPHGGQIHIAAKSDQQGHVQLTIRDEGEGITDAILKQLGQPFITTKEKGTGLGLMISNRIIEEHNGTLQIFSKQEEGTTIQIVIPSVSS